MPKGFDLGEPDPVQEFVRGAGALPPSRAIGDEQLTTQLNATQQRFLWHSGNPRVKQGYTLQLSEPLMLKLEWLRERGIGSKKAQMEGAIERETDRLLIEAGVPPGAL